MEAHREIREVTSDTLTISVPDALRNHRVEVILLPVDEDSEAPRPGNGWAAGFLERFAGSLPDFPDIADAGGYENRERLP